MTPRLFIKQKITPFVNKYRVLQANSDATEGQLIGMAQQKRIALREKVMFYSDETRSKLTFTFRAEKVMDVHGRYFVEDGNGKPIGMFKKEFTASLVNSTWKILDKDGNERYIVKESSMALALLRRFVGMLPIVGDLAEIIVMFFKYHFVFIDIQTSQVVGMYQKTTLMRDHYRLDMTDEAWANTDWRVFAAMCVALDALQSR